MKTYIKKTLKIHQIKHNTFIALVLFLVKKFGRNKKHNVHKNNAAVRYGTFIRY